MTDWCLMCRLRGESPNSEIGSIFSGEERWVIPCCVEHGRNTEQRDLRGGRIVTFTFDPHPDDPHEARLRVSWRGIGRWQVRMVRLRVPDGKWDSESRRSIDVSFGRPGRWRRKTAN
jgi:hypothetical protein